MDKNSDVQFESASLLLRSALNCFEGAKFILMWLHRGFIFIWFQIK